MRSMSWSCRSTRATAGASLMSRVTSSASRPVAAITAVYPRRRRMSLIVLTIWASSSTTRTLCPSGSEDFIQYFQESIRRERLVQTRVNKAGRHRRSRLIERRTVSAAKYQGHGWAQVLYRQHGLRRGDSVEPQVQHYRAWRGAFEHSQRLIQSCRRKGRVAILLEDHAQRLQECGIIVHDQNSPRSRRRLLQYFNELSDRHRLRQNPQRPFPLRFRKDLGRRIRCHQDDADPRANRLHRLERFETVDPGHTDVHQHDCVVPLPHGVDGCLAAVGTVCFPAVQSHHVDESSYHLLIVIDD